MARNIIFCDIDGIICDVRHRLHYAMDKNWDEYYRRDYAMKDSVIYGGVNLLKMLADSCCRGDIYFVTGRREECRGDTVEWMRHNGLIRYLKSGIDNLLMRPVGDLRPSYRIKPEQIKSVLSDEELLEEDINVYFIDDDPKNVAAVAEKFPQINCLTFGADRLMEINQYPEF